jgi:hypothetical protein
MLDVVAQAFHYLHQSENAVTVLERAKYNLEHERTLTWTNWGNSKPRKTYSGALADVYRGRLARSMSAINLDVAFEWADDIQASAVKLPCLLWFLQASNDLDGVGRHLDRVRSEVCETHRLDEAVSLREGLLPWGKHWRPSADAVIRSDRCGLRDKMACKP